MWTLVISLRWSPMSASEESGLKAAILPERGVLRLSGPDMRAFLQGLVTNNVESAGPGEAIYSALLTPQGKFLFDFFIVEDAEGCFLLDCEAERAAALAKRLTMYKLRAKVEIEDLTESHCVAALWDGEAAATAPDEGTLFPDPRLAALGTRAILPREDVAGFIASIGAEEATPEAWHRHRILLGVGDATYDFEAEKSFPLELNLDELHGIDFKKGCYVGQEVTSRTKRRGSVRKRLLPCAVKGAMPAPGTPVKAGTREVGTVFSGDRKTGRVLALLRLDLLSGQTLDANDATLVPEVPDWAGFSLEDSANADE
ncbi:CAF17-like 4Fe-4S cluster assembly/insertion protein YgfZ [Parvibaculum sp. MBR-TMA-1.3b-4.2]|jgi:folate-binding protein YgfZ